MLKIEIVNLKETQELIGDMRDKIDALAPIGGDSAMSLELFNWQSEDMRRRYPEVEEPDPFTAVTHIYPRSRKERPRQPTLSHTRARRTSRPMLHIRGPRVKSMRSILRPELFERLVERMARMLQEKITWR